MHDLSRDIPLHLRAANSIWPSCQLELDARRLELDKAIAACWMLMDELQYVAEALPADFNKFTKLALKIEELVNKIKAEKGCGHRKPSFTKHRNISPSAH